MIFSNFNDFIIFWLENPKKQLEFREYSTKSGMLVYRSNLIISNIAYIDEIGNFKFYFVIGNRKHFKNILPIIQANKSLYKKFLLLFNFVKQEMNKDEYSIRYEDIWNMIDTYRKPEIYTIFKKYDIEFREYLSQYLLEYDCFSVFFDVFREEVKDRLLDKPYRYSTYYQWSEVWCSDEEVKAKIEGMERVLKIYLILNSD